jgi:hypothetical protein
MSAMEIFGQESRENTASNPRIIKQLIGFLFIKIPF